MLPLPDTLIWGALGLAVLLCLARQRLSGLMLLGVSLLLALWLERITPPALLFTLVGLVLAWPALLGPGGTMRWRPLALLILPLAALLITAWQLEALRPEAGLPHWWWLFAFNNLLFTCVAEEALFRGLIQQGIAARSRVWLGVLVASLLFGAAHLAGGPLLMLFAALAGACYGLAFQLSGRLAVAIVLHFLFNFAHLALFTYPLANR
ncbi:CPBP family intramembrane glutamic endopeptidase [Aeromonas sobria]|uniref:CPBP family intramembrane glutamic endopeptidase n=1 Tax=Aeromonas sobria TaxID=646 RepID=UPI003D07B9F3